MDALLEKIREKREAAGTRPQELVPDLWVEHALKLHRAERIVVYEDGEGRPVVVRELTWSVARS